MGRAKEFKDDPITENSEVCQRLRQAEARLKGYVLTTKTCSLPKVPVQRCRLEQRSVQNSTGPVPLLKQFWTLEHQLSAQKKKSGPRRHQT